MEKFYKNKKGQSLIEVVVATFILSTALTAVLVLVVQNFIAARPPKLKTQAAYLAQEGTEIVRNIRDTTLNRMNAGDAAVTRWDQFFYPNSTNGWHTLNAYDVNTGYALTFASSSETPDKTGSPNYYTLDNVNFTRYILVENVVPVDPDKRKVTVRVTWPEEKSGTQTIQNYLILSNWQ